MRITVYGGSFNPPHWGHEALARLASSSLQPDKLLIIPDYLPPHKELAENSPTPEERLALCRLAFGEIPRAEISDRELRRSGRSYTADTVDELLEEYPGAELTLVIGTDMLQTFENWRRAEELMQRCTLAAAARDREEEAVLEAHAALLRERYGARVILMRAEPLPMSSGEIRTLLPQRRGSGLLSDAVYSEIIRRRYYGAKPDLNWLREKSYVYLHPKRVPHVEGCAGEAVRLAERWGENTENACEAGILHDITKNLKDNEELKLCERYGIVLDNAERENGRLLHARTGAAFARDLFGIPDEIYSAIRWHTTAKPGMSLLEKIIYLADYIEPTRDFPGVDELRAEARRDLDAAMALGLKMSLEDIRSYGIEPYIDSVEAYDWYTKLKEAD